MMRNAMVFAVILFFAVVALPVKIYAFQQDSSLLKTAIDLVALPVFSAQELVYKNRLDSIKCTVPLTYNSYVQKYIDIYASRSKQISKVLGLSKYYFPIFDKSFKQYNIPDEIKFLSIVESALDPLAVSRTGATGPWQFTLNTAKGYGLAMNAYVDERRDPVAASLAAANYLRNAYTVLGDWLLAIASYNCGQGAVARAIKKAGNVYDFWAIRQYLPVETQNYVPAFIATTYIMNCYQKHGIVPVAAAFSQDNDMLLVDKFVSLSSLAQAANIDVQQLALLNPLYKTDIINGSALMPKPIVLPAGLSIVAFQAMYESLNHSLPSPDTAIYVAAINSPLQKEFRKVQKQAPSKKYLTYKVKAGDTLSDIAQKFDGTSVSKIKSHNHLRSSSLQTGMVLKITKG